MGLLDALQDKGFRNDVADGLRNALNRGSTPAATSGSRSTSA
jgi:hypothetical protein